MLRKILFLSALFLFLLPNFLYSETTLKLYLPFNEGKGDVVYDKAGNLKAELHHTTWTEGRFGKGLFFNGKGRDENGSYVVLPNTKKSSFFQTFDDGPFTIEVWIKPDSKKNYKEQAEIINTSGDIGPGYRLTFAWRMVYFRSGTGKRKPGGNADYWNVQTNPSVHKVNLDTWNHIAVTRDKEGILTLYLNGEEVGKSKEIFKVSTGNRPITIAAYISGYAYHFQGVIDEVKIYQGAKNPEEILKDSKGLGEDLSIHLDGNLNEPLWKKAKKYTNFLVHPKGIKTKVQTTGLIAYDDQYLYFGLIADEPLISQLKNNIKENNLKVYRDDCLEIMVDADNNSIDYYHFLLNPSGYKGQRFCTQSGIVGNRWDNGNWYVATKIEESKWVAEVAIPFSILNLEEALKNEITFNICRDRRTSGNLEETSLIKNGGFNKPAYFQKFSLKGIELAKYNYRISQPLLSKTSQKEGKLNVVISLNLKNKTKQEKELRTEGFLISKKGEVFPYFSSFLLKPEQERPLALNFKLKTPGDYQFLFSLSAGKKFLLLSTYFLKIEFIPLSLDITQPFYRDNIYATEKIKKIKAIVKIGLTKEEIAGSNLTVSLNDEQNKTISSKKYRNINLNHNISLPLPDLADGRYILIVNLSKKNKLLAKTEKTVHKLPPAKGNEVRIDKDLNMLLNGKPFLPIIWWGGFPFEEIAKAGADGIVVGFTKDSRNPLEQLQEIGQFGEVMLMGGNTEKKLLLNKKELSKEAKEYIVEAVNLIKEHPSLLCYYLTDEPEGRALSSHLLGQEYQLIKELDPYHPVLICNNSVNGLYTYANCLDMFFPDPYLCPIKNNGFSRPMTYISTFMENAKKAGKGKKLIGITPQVFNYGECGQVNGREPSFTEERCMQFLAIIHGARAFNYYVYGGKKGKHGAIHYPDLRIGVPYIIKEIKSLAPAILEGKELKGTISDDNVHLLIKRYQGKLYIFAANILPKFLSAKLTLPNAVKKLKVISENREIELNKNSFTDNFIPYGVHIYTDNLNFADLASLKRIEKEIKSAGGMFALIY